LQPPACALNCYLLLHVLLQTYKNIPDVIAAMEDPSGRIPDYFHGQRDSVKVYEGGWKGGRGLADRDGHPFCYLLLNSEVR